MLDLLTDVDRALIVASLKLATLEYAKLAQMYSWLDKYRLVTDFERRANDTAALIERLS